MEKLTIFVDTELKEKMSKYDLNWSYICTKAIEKELETLEQSRESFGDFFDVDIDLHKSTSRNTAQLNPEVYKVIKKGWIETFGVYRNSNSPSPPSSKEVKKIWEIFQEDDNWDYDAFIDEYSEGLPKINPNSNTQWYLVNDCLNSVMGYDELEWEEWEFIEFFSKFVYDGKILDEIVLLDPFKLNSLSIENRDNLPSKSCIYFVINDSKVYYIGMTQNLYNRWFNHHRQDDFDKISTPIKISFLELPIQYLRQLESEFIKRYKPLLNIAGNK